MQFSESCGQTGRLIEAFDWSRTSIGPLALWPRSLKTMLGFLLRSPVPMVMLWGEDGVMLYNDAYSEFAGGRHPQLLGSKVREGWPEVAEFNDNVMRVGLAGGTLAYKDQELTLHRHGQPEQVWMNLDYSPVPGDDGRPAGVMAIVIETTERVAAERQRQQAEVALRLERDRAQGVLDNMGEAFVLLDRDCRFVDMNAEAMRMEKRPKQALIGKTHAEAHPNAHPALDDLYQQALSERQAVSLEHRYTWPDGRVHWIDMRAYPVEDGLAVFYRDVTARRQAETAQRESEERLRLVQAAGGIGGFDHDLRKDVAICSPEFYAIVGLPDGSPINRTTWSALLHPDDAVEAVAALDRAIARGKPFDYEYRIVRADTGQTRWLSGRAAILFDADGRPSRCVGGNIDVTARRNAEEAIRELNETLEDQVAQRTAERDRMWDTSPDLMLVIDFDGVLRRVNPAWTTILGYASDELVGHHVSAFVVPDDRPETAGASAMATLGSRSTLENRYRHKDGSVRWISWVAAPADDMTYATGRDVTAERARAADLEAAQEQLRQAQKMEAVGQLTGGIAHDFNNLLTGVIGSLDMMQRRIAKGETDRIDRYATTALTAANRAAALTHRLLAFSRRQPLDPKPVNASRLVTGMEDLLRRTIGESVHLDIVTGAGLWQTMCDPHQLENAVLNLAINARDAMPDGGMLTIETCNAHLDDSHAARERDVRPGHYICICVSDTGGGMSKETVEKAFEPFFTTKPIGQGTGLGLSMIYGFTRQSEGYARIYSEIGQGTTIKLYLPRHDGEAEAADEPQGALTEAHRAEPGEVVVVVEDETAVRDLVVDVLQELGYRAVEAADGPSGLKLLLSNRRVDLLVTDIGLPGLNGRQVADAARQHRPDLKILFMTGYAENATIANGFLEPGMQMITKPFAIDTLATRIRDMIEGAGGA